MGSDAPQGFLPVGRPYFNPRSRMGSDSALHLDITVDDISIHAPAWGATAYHVSRAYENRYFNPRSRMGSDQQHGKESQRSIISIHAPAWGATIFVQECVAVTYISIHAPAWGATFLIYRHTMQRYYFNPRSRMGSDFEN